MTRDQAVEYLRRLVGIIILGMVLTVPIKGCADSERREERLLVAAEQAPLPSLDSEILDYWGEKIASVEAETLALSDRMDWDYQIPCDIATSSCIKERATTVYRFLWECCWVVEPVVEEFLVNGVLPPESAYDAMHKAAILAPPKSLTQQELEAWSAALMFYEEGKYWTRPQSGNVPEDPLRTCARTQTADCLKQRTIAVRQSCHWDSDGACNSALQDMIDRYVFREPWQWPTAQQVAISQR